MAGDGQKVQESNTYSVHKGISQLVFSAHQNPEGEAGAGEGWTYQQGEDKEPRERLFPSPTPVLCRPPAAGSAHIRNDLLTSN